MLTWAKIKEQKVFLNIFENNLPKVMSMQSFRFIRLVDKTLGEEVGEESLPWETNEHE